MIEITESVLNEAIRFSDWRLYSINIADCCALEGLRDENNASSSITTRSWILYDNLPSALKIFCDKLIFACTENSNPWRCFNIDFTDGKSRLRYRSQEMGGYFACKQILTKPPDLDNLSGLSDPVKSLLLAQKLRTTGGLILMVGDTGTGKTTTASAAVRERLKKFGGYCLVLSDPPEQPLGDDNGHLVGSNGYVDEIDVSEIGYTKGLTHSLRSFPIGQSGILFYGEIRSDSNAFDLINASCDGHEVISTMHAMSPDAALERLISWGVRSGVPVDVVRSLLAQSLFGIVFHRLEYGRFILSAYLVTEDAKQKIRDGHALPIKSTTVSTITAARNR